MIVRAATYQDALPIIALTAEYYRRRGADPQFREFGTWHVVEGDNEQILAAQNWVDTGDGERWLMDTYCLDSRLGRLALARLTRYTHSKADEDGVALLGVSEMDNEAVGSALEARGWEVVGILRRRPPGAKRTPRRTSCLV